MRNYRSLYTKFLMVMAPIALVSFLIFLSVYEWFNYRQAYSRLKDKMAVLSASQSLILAKAVADSNKAQIQLVIASTISDPYVRGVAVYNQSGSLLEQFGSGFSKQNGLVRKTTINFADENHFKEVGTLFLVFTDQPIIDGIKQHLVYSGALIMLLLASAVVSSYVAQRFTIDQGLKRLLKSIKLTENSGKRKAVEWESNDELGQVIAAYNTMQLRQSEYEKELLAVHKDLSQEIAGHKDAKRILFEEKERAFITLQSIGDAVITTDAAGAIQYINPIAETLTGWNLDECLRAPLEKVFKIFHENSNERLPDPVQQCLNQKSVVRLDDHTILISRSGERYSIQDSTAPIRGGEGNILGAVLVFTDVTESRRVAKELSYQASHDHLTGLINRRAFEQRLSQVLEHTRDDETEHALCYLDLDQFKVINDTGGHVAGDNLLCQLASLFKTTIRKSDTLARLGGDEFGVLMEQCSLQQAGRVANKMRKAIQDFRFVSSGQIFRVGVSIGLVPITVNTLSTSDVLMAADEACYAAKEGGRNRIHVYSENDQELARQHGEMQWVEKINRALDQDLFCLYRQPIASINDPADINRYELLVRMQGQKGEIITPEAFLPAAERYNLSPKLDRWVVDKAFSWLAKRLIHLETLNSYSINLSGHSLGDQEFHAFMIRCFDKFKIPPHKICFEITETAAISNLYDAKEFMNEVKTLGCQFALDDFGTGLSSFAYLKNLPIDYLKIDGIFVKGSVTDKIDLAMVRSINEIGHVMGKITIAEFVENQNILEALRAIGVDYAQGFAIGRPSPIDEVSKDGRISSL